MNKWHYQLHGRTTGPVTPGELRRQIAAGRVTGRTMVWHDELPDWLPLAESELAPLLTEPLDERFIAREIAVIYQLFRGYWILVFLSCITFMVGLSMVVSLLANYRTRGELSDGWLAAAISVNGAALLTGIAATVIWLLLIYRGWKAIPPECAETTPGRAVGFLCIPIFNWYWNFIGIGDLGKALNAQIQRDEIRVPLVKERLCTAYCVLRAMDLLVVPALLALIVGLFVPGQLCRGALAIWQNRLRERLADAQNAAAKQEFTSKEKE